MSQYEILACKYAGPLTSSGAFLLWMKDWDRQYDRYYYFWVIRGEDIVVLVDAGVPPRLARAKHVPNYTNPVDVLYRIGIQAADVKNVILTHIHWDHSSGIELYPNATFYVQKKEFDFWLNDPVAKKPPFAHVSDDVSNDLLAARYRSGQVKLLEGDQEILPGIKTILAPGHTPALQAVAVDTEKGIAVLGSDCAHVARSYKEEWPSCLITDLVGWMKSFDKLKQVAASVDLIFPGHDTLMLTSYPKIAEDVTRLV